MPDGSRWDDLFADLDGQADALSGSERDAAVGELARAEAARQPLLDRLAGFLGVEVGLRLLGLPRLTLRLSAVGGDWVAGVDERGDQLLLPVTGLAEVGWPATLGGAAPDGLDRRTGLGAPLRRLARDRCAVSVSLTDGSVLTGTVDRVGLDHLDLAEHGLDAVRRPAEVRRLVTVPFTAVLLVRRPR